jgi:hypothetical protein
VWLLAAAVLFLSLILLEVREIFKLFRHFDFQKQIFYNNLLQGLGAIHTSLYQPYIRVS